VVGTVCIGAFIGQVDASIVQLAMPTFEDAFDAPLHALSWVAVGYVLAYAAALPVFARLAEIGGRKAVYLAGFALFGLFSALCGLAPDLPLLIVLRILQGASGAALGANSLVILVAAAGPERRGKAVGVMAAAQAVGLSLGPALGGALLAAFGWRAIFWVTVPFALLGAALGWLIVPKTKVFAQDDRFDALGAALLVPVGVAAASAMLSWRLEATVEAHGRTAARPSRRCSARSAPRSSCSPPSPRSARSWRSFATIRKPVGARPPRRRRRALSRSRVLSREPARSLLLTAEANRQPSRSRAGDGDVLIQFAHKLGGRKAGRSTAATVRQQRQTQPGRRNADGRLYPHLPRSDRLLPAPPRA
jgi:hypothetical protein